MIHLEDRGDVALITIDRPDRRNALDMPSLDELLDVHRRVDGARVVVLTGAGGHFCAGADLKAMAAGEDAVHLDLPPAPGPLGVSREVLGKPVVAAVEGAAVAGGLELALWCDLRVAAEDATFGVYSRRFGVPLVDLGTVRLPRLIGHSHAMDMILTGRGVSAQEALMMGLANRVVPTGQALNAAVAMATQIAAYPQTCLRADRRMAIEQWDLDNERWHLREYLLGRNVLMSGEVADGVRRFASGQGRHGTSVPPRHGA